VAFSTPSPSFASSLDLIAAGTVGAGGVFFTMCEAGREVKLPRKFLSGSMYFSDGMEKARRRAIRKKNVGGLMVAKWYQYGGKVRLHHRIEGVEVPGNVITVRLIL
jgi:hypothetical protein